MAPAEADDDVEAAWSEEIRQRLADVDAGVVAPIPWPEARRRIFAAASGRREALEIQPAALAAAAPGTAAGGA